MYSCSIRVVENCHSAVAIARRITVSQRSGRPVSVAVVVARDDVVLEVPVEVQRVGPVLRGLVRVGLATADGPAVVAVVALVPPAVEDAEVEDAVLRGLHAAGAGRLQRPPRGVEPDVDALHQEAGDVHVVVLEEEDAAGGTRGDRRALEDLLDELLAGLVGRMGLAGEDDLDRSLRVARASAPAGRGR